MADENSSRGIASEVNELLSNIFRHMLPGVLVVAMARAAHPEWFNALDFGTWQAVGILAIISITVGNVAFAFNRYIVDQITDRILWQIGSVGPARTTESKDYKTDIAWHTLKIFAQDNRRMQDHLRFRSSATFLLWTLAELLAFATYSHSPNTVFDVPITFRAIAP